MRVRGSAAVALAIVLALTTFLELAADTVELYDGTKVETDSLTYDGREFTLKDDKKVPLNAVKSIALQAPEVSRELTGEVSEDVKQLLQMANEAQKQFPDSKAIILIDQGKEEMRQDQTHLYTYRVAVKILHSDRLSFADRSLGFEEERSRARVIQARSIDPDGTVHNYDPASVKITEPARGAVYFGRGKSITYTIPCVKVGSIVDYTHQWEVFNPYDWEMFFPSWSFAGEDPFVESTMEITIPRTKTLNYLAERMPPDAQKPTEIIGQDTHTYKWQLKNQPAVIKEPYMPPIADIVPHLECSPFSDFNYIKEWATQRIPPRMKPTAELESLVAEVTKNAQTEEEKIAALYHYVQQNIDYISIKGSIASGLCGHPAAETLRNKYGDCIDCAILFATLLRIAGVEEAYPVWVNTNTSPRIPTKIATLGGNHAITQIRTGDKTFFLDPTASYYRYPTFRWDDHGIVALNPLTGTLYEVEPPDPSLEAENYEMEVSLSQNGDAEVKQKFTATGSTEAAYRAFFDKQNEERKLKYQQSLINSYSPSAKLISYSTRNEKDTSKPFEWRCEFVLPSYITNAGDVVILRIPGLEYEFPEVALQERKYDIHYPTVSQVTHHVVMNLPDTYKVRYVPAAVRFVSSYCSYGANYTVQGNKIVFEDKYIRSKRIVPVADYAAHKEILQKIASYSRQRVFLQAGK
jgi:transglutaminase-like putative cysteine protease